MILSSPAALSTGVHFLGALILTRGLSEIKNPQVHKSPALLRFPECEARRDEILPGIQQ